VYISQFAKVIEEWPINLRQVPTSHHINRFVYLHGDNLLRVDPQPQWAGHQSLDIVTPIHSFPHTSSYTTPLGHHLMSTATTNKNTNNHNIELQAFGSQSSLASSSSTSSFSSQGFARFPRVELLIGFRSGDILVHDPISKRITKQFNRHVRDHVLQEFFDVNIQHTALGTLTLCASVM
jgi:hypothetical protein